MSPSEAATSRPIEQIDQPDLAAWSYLRLPAQAPAAFRVHRIDALAEALERAAALGVPLPLGAGSNVWFAHDTAAIPVQIACAGIREVDRDGDAVLIEADAGVNWDQLVRQTTEAGLAGLENLALIPGSVGAAPIQNIGAYGVELAATVDRVFAIDRTSGAAIEFAAAQCEFEYRDSLFKRNPGRYLLTAVRFALVTRFEPRLRYAGVMEELGRVAAGDLTPARVAEAVRALRRRKLPDPAREPNLGSFFKNPVVGITRAEAIAESLPGLTGYPAGDARVKLPAAALIEACGLKGRSVGGAAVSDRHALVIVNTGAATGRDVDALAMLVTESVARRFGVNLEMEPRRIGVQP